MSNYFETREKKNCNGCGVCSLVCPKKCITMEEDSEGFLYPVIDETKCIKCGLCKRICSNNPLKNNYNIKNYAAKNNNLSERMESTSGGMFKILCKYVFEKNGLVYGAYLDDKLKVQHGCAKDMETAKKFSGSKYVRSNSFHCYKEILENLKKDILILFSGTPCQCYSLKKYLGKDYNNLIICETICHSNPSPKIYEIYKKSLEKKENKKIKSYFFRSKNKEMNCGPYVVFDDNSMKETNIYNKAFNEMLISRPSCSACKFCDINRKSDITIGDFWGIEHYKKDFSDGLGVSLISVNSEKGEKIFEYMSGQIEFLGFDSKDAFKYNHHSNIKEHKYRGKFFEKIDNGQINEDNIECYMRKYLKENILISFARKVKRYLKKIGGNH